MITANEIKSALFPIAPAAHRKYRGTATTYITFFMYNEQAEAYAENEPIAGGTYWQIDLWRTKDDPCTVDSFELKNQIESALKALGFEDFTAQDLYESDTETDHMAIRCNYIE